MIGASAPPASITSASPNMISRAGVANGVGACRAGGDHRVVGTLEPVPGIETWPETRLMMLPGDEERG